MITKQIITSMLTALFIFLLAAGCGGGTEPHPPTPPPFPTERPELTTPTKFDLASPLTVVQNQKVTIDSDIENHSFIDCEVHIANDDIKIASSEFANSPVYIEQKKNISLDRVIFRQLNQYEKAAVNVYQCQDLVVENCQFAGNYIGMGIHSSSAEVTGNRFEDNNGHNALVIGEGSQANVNGNYFYGSFPHAILILNREDSSEARVDITDNIIDQTGEDAIDFEDYRNAAPSNVSHNIITNSGWSAVVIEYNSWESNITVEDNWIEGTGIDWKLSTHALQPEVFQPGWGHGILVEDSSKVQIRNNRILSAGENGIEIKNSSEITLERNGINCTETGIGVHRYEEASLSREFSPLAPENADGSHVIASDNIIYQAQQDYEVDEWSELTAQ
jgi:parallel beta-helix repeat protein